MQFEDLQIYLHYRFYIDMILQYFFDSIGNLLTGLTWDLMISRPGWKYRGGEKSQEEKDKYVLHRDLNII